METDRVEECRLTLSIINKSHVLKEFPWVVYVFLAELFMRSALCKVSCDF